MFEPCINTSETNSSHQDNPVGKCNFTGVEDVLFYALHVILAILVLFSIITNAIVIYIFLSKKFGRVTSAKILYANMSLSDELTIITWILQVTIPDWSTFPIWIQAVFRYASPVAAFVSGYTMALIALKRYQVISMPFYYMRSRDRSKKWMLISIVVIWSLSIGVSVWLYPFVTPEPLDASYFAKVCAFINSRVDVPLVETFWSLTLLVILPFVLGLAFSVAASYRIFKLKHPGHFEPKAWQLAKLRKIKSILMIMAVVIVFATFSSPVVVLYAIESLRYQEIPFCDYNYYLHGALLVMFLMTFVLNPIIYWYLNDDFKLGVRRIKSSVFCKPQPAPEPNRNKNELTEIRNTDRNRDV